MEQQQQLATAADLKKQAAKKLGANLFLPELEIWVHVKRIQRGTYIKSERMPDALLGVAVKHSGEAASALGGFTGSDLKELIEFTEQVVLDCVDSLKIVRENAGEDEVLLSDIPDRDQDVIFNYAVHGKRSIEMEGGESVTRDELAGFREESILPSAGDHSANLSAETQ